MLLCSNCSAPISSGDTSCVVCGAAQTSPLEIIMPPAPSVPATIPRDERPKRRPSRATMTIVGISVVALVLTGALATLLIGTRGTLVTTRGQLSAASGRLSDLRTRYDDLQGQIEQLQKARDDGRSQLDHVRAASRDTRESLDACQGLFRLGVTVGSRGPSASQTSKAASLLTSCFQGDIPPGLFP
jgi:hypothetical protein